MHLRGWSLCLTFAALANGCDCGGDDTAPPACGGAGQACCAPDTCDPGLVCAIDGDGLTCRLSATDGGSMDAGPRDAGGTGLDAGAVDGGAVDTGAGSGDAGAGDIRLAEPALVATGTEIAATATHVYLTNVTGAGPVRLSRVPAGGGPLEQISVTTSDMEGNAYEIALGATRVVFTKRGGTALVHAATLGAWPAGTMPMQISLVGVAGRYQVGALDADLAAGASSTYYFDYGGADPTPARLVRLAETGGTPQVLVSALDYLTLGPVAVRHDGSPAGHAYYGRGDAADHQHIYRVRIDGSAPSEMFARDIVTGSNMGTLTKLLVAGGWVYLLKDGRPTAPIVPSWVGRVAVMGAVPGTPEHLVDFADGHALADLAGDDMGVYFATTEGTFQVVEGAAPMRVAPAASSIAVNATHLFWLAPDGLWARPR